MAGISIISGNGTDGCGARFKLSASVDSLGLNSLGRGHNNDETPKFDVSPPSYCALLDAEQPQDYSEPNNPDLHLIDTHPRDNDDATKMNAYLPTDCDDPGTILGKDNFLGPIFNNSPNGETDRAHLRTGTVSSNYDTSRPDSSSPLEQLEGGYKSVDPRVHRDDLSLQDQLRMQHSILAQPSTISIASLTNSTDQSESSANAKQALVSLLSGLYALLLIILAFAFEMSLVNVAQHLRSDYYELFYIYLYSVSIAFLVFCCVLLTDHTPIMEGFRKVIPITRTLGCLRLPHPDPSNSGDSTIEGPGYSNSSTIPVNDKYARSPEGSTCTRQLVGASHAAPATGSLYLRLGAIVFGTVGVVQNCLQFFSYFETSCFSTSTVITLVLFTVFLYGQVYFIFLNSKIVIHRCQIAGRFGLMHLIATNLCVWIRSLVEEEYHLSEEITESQNAIFRGNKSISSESSESSEDFSDILSPAVAQLIKCSQDSENVMTEILHDVKPFMTTCVIEYSLICAAVMLIIWMNVGNGQVEEAHRHRKHNIRVDCSASNKGLFSGLLFLVFTLVSMVIFFVEVHTETERGVQKALLVFYCSDITLYTVTIVACVVAFRRFRLLRFVNMKGKSSKFIRRSTLLDDILLMVALIGQVMFCIFSIVAVVEMTTQAVLHICVAVLRLVQVLVQTVVILIGQRMVAASSRSREQKPGREMITFLLVGNIALWLINTFEAQKASANPLLVRLYGDAPQAWTFIVHSTIPLTIFFRFHSTVCFAEIWKNAYKTK